MTVRSMTPPGRRQKSADPKPQRGRAGRALVALLGVLVVIAAFVVALHTPLLSFQQWHLGVPRGEGIGTVRVLFERADRIDSGTEVRYGEKVVGRVSDVETDGGDAIVTAALDLASQPLPAGAFAEIQQPTALGSPFVALIPPTAKGNAGGGSLADGDEIPRARTTRGPDLESSLASVGMLLNGSGIDQLKTIMDELSTALGGRGPKLADLRGRAEDVLALYEQNKGTLDATLDALDKTTSALAERRDLLDRGMSVSADLVTQVADNRDSLAALVDTTSSLSAQLDDFTSTTEGHYGPVLGQTQSILSDLQSLDGDTGPILDKLSTFVDLFTSAAPGDYLAFDGALDVPGSLDELYTGGRARTDGPGEAQGIGSGGGER